MADRLNTIDMDKAWKLHTKGLEPQEIADICDISKASVRRVIKACEAVINNDHDALADENLTVSIRQYAMDKFGAPVPPTEEKPLAPDNTARFLVAVLDEINRTNALLEKLCKAWGVE